MSDSNSSSDSSQKQIQESQDNRVSGGTGSVNLVTSRSSIGGNVNIKTTDFGAVTKAFDFASVIAQGAANESAASGAAVQQIATSAMQSVRQAYEGSAGEVAAAYQTAKSGEQKVMVGVGLAILGIVAMKALGK